MNSSTTFFNKPGTIWNYRPGLFKKSISLLLFWNIPGWIKYSVPTGRGFCLGFPFYKDVIPWGQIGNNMQWVFNKNHGSFSGWVNFDFKIRIKPNRYSINLLQQFVAYKNDTSTKELWDEINKVLGDVPDEVLEGVLDYLIRIVVNW